MATTDDLVHETTAGTGTGNLTVGAFNGRQRFSDAFGTGVSTDVFYYFIANRQAAEWEVGTGHMSDANTLVRDTVIASSNADAAVDFAAGTKDVTSDLPASVQLAVMLDAEILALAGLTSAANKVPMFSGAGTAALLDFLDEDNMASDSATALASQQSIKAYADLKLALAGGTMSGNIAMGGSKVTGLDAATTNGDALRYEQLVGLYLLLAGGTLSGELNLADNLLTRPKIKDYGEAVNALGSGGGTRTVDLTLGNVVTATVSTSTNTFAFSNPSASGVACSFTLILTNGGSQTVNWPAAVYWAGGTAPTLTTSGIDILTFVTIDGGTTWYGFAGGLDMS